MGGSVRGGVLAPPLAPVSDGTPPAILAIRKGIEAQSVEMVMQATVDNDTSAPFNTCGR